MTRLSRREIGNIGVAMITLAAELHGDAPSPQAVAEHCDGVIDSFAACDDHEYWPREWLPLPRHRIAQLAITLEEGFNVEPTSDPDMLRRHRKFIVPTFLRAAGDSPATVSQLRSAHGVLATAMQSDAAPSSATRGEDQRILDELYTDASTFQAWVDPGDADADELRAEMEAGLFDDASAQVLERVPDLDGSAHVALMRFCWDAGADLCTTGEEWDDYVEEGVQILASVWAQGVSITEAPPELMSRLDAEWPNEFPFDPTDANEWEARRLWKFRPSPFLLDLLTSGELADDYVAAALTLADWADDRVIVEALDGLSEDFALYEALLQSWATMDLAEVHQAMTVWPDEAFTAGGPFEGWSSHAGELEVQTHALAGDVRRSLGEALAAGSATEVRAEPRYVQATDNTTGRCFGCGKANMVANRYCRACMRGRTNPQPVATAATAAAPRLAVLDGEQPGQAPLRVWQRQALEAWSDAGCRGVVQAVTGTGKTRVGLQAAAAHRAAGGQVLVLVPTRALLNQWDRQLVDWFGRRCVGRLGDGHHDSFRSHDVLVATPHSARKGTGLRGDGLLIADECHRYGSETWATALDGRFGLRLGLTATYSRQDEGDELLAGYFGGEPVFDIDYRRAIDEHVVSAFRLAFVGVDLGREDMTAYVALDEACRRAAGKLINEFGLPAQPFGAFMKAVARAADGDEGGPAQRAAWTYQSNFAKRRALLADTPAKLTRLGALEPAVARAHGTLVFTQTKAASQAAAELFAQKGHPSAAIWGELDGDQREYLLEAFRRGDRTVLSAPRVLDEGIDVPDADLGIVLSASRGRRQMIQRMGRVLRQKSDGRLARLVILYAASTSEDPSLGAHEGFIDLAWNVAAARKIFSPTDSAASICHFLETGS